MNSTFIAIDLSSTNLCAHTARDSKVELLHLQGERLFPTSISFSSRGRYYGPNSVNLKTKSSYTTFWNIPAFLSLDLVADHQSHFRSPFFPSFTVSELGHVNFSVKYQNTDFVFRIHELLAMLFTFIKNQLPSPSPSSSPSSPPSFFFIVPSWFSTRELAYIKAATMIADISLGGFVSPFSALTASMIYKHREQLKEEEYIIFADFGYFGSQICLSKIEKGNSQTIGEIIAQKSNPNIGLVALDKIIYSYLVSKIPGQISQSFKIELAEQCCEARTKLFSCHSAAVNVTQSPTYSTTITVPQFQGLYQPFVDSLSDFLTSFSLFPEFSLIRPSKIVTVGGLSFFPPLKELLKTTFRCDEEEPGKTGPTPSLNRSEDVSLGGSLVASSYYKKSPFNDFKIINKFFTGFFLPQNLYAHVSSYGLLNSIDQGRKLIEMDENLSTISNKKTNASNLLFKVHDDYQKLSADFKNFYPDPISLFCSKEETILKSSQLSIELVDQSLLRINDFYKHLMTAHETWTKLPSVLVIFVNDGQLTFQEFIKLSCSQDDMIFSAVYFVVKNFDCKFCEKFADENYVNFLNFSIQNFNILNNLKPNLFAQIALKYSFFTRDVLLYKRFINELTLEDQLVFNNSANFLFEIFNPTPTPIISELTPFSSLPDSFDPMLVDKLSLIAPRSPLMSKLLFLKSLTNFRGGKSVENALIDVENALQIFKCEEYLFLKGIILLIRSQLPDSFEIFRQIIQFPCKCLFENLECKFKKYCSRIFLICKFSNGYCFSSALMEIGRFIDDSIYKPRLFATARTIRYNPCRDFFFSLYISEFFELIEIFIRNFKNGDHSINQNDRFSAFFAPSVAVLSGRPIVSEIFNTSFPFLLFPSAFHILSSFSINFPSSFPPPLFTFLRTLSYCYKSLYSCGFLLDLKINYCVLKLSQVLFALNEFSSVLELLVSFEIKTADLFTKCSLKYLQAKSLMYLYDISAAKISFENLLACQSSDFVVNNGISFKMIIKQELKLLNLLEKFEIESGVDCVEKLSNQNLLSLSRICSKLKLTNDYLYRSHYWRNLKNRDKIFDVSVDLSWSPSPDFQ
ncbi:hypothetical protein RCL1_006528 [Eukaryota sp. TZLM3-RCL]